VALKRKRCKAKLSDTILVKQTMPEDWRERFRSWLHPDTFAHPDSPSGGSGTGRSRPPGFTSYSWSGVPHPDSPAGRHFDWESALRRKQIVANESDIEKLKLAIERAFPKLPRDVREKLAEMLTPKALSIFGVIAAAGVGSHWIGIGEVVDVVLIGWGVWTLGPDALNVSRDLHQFVTTATRAQTDRDIDRAADHFARAIAVIGVDGLAAIILDKAFEAVSEIRGAASVQSQRLGFEWTEAQTLDEQIAIEQAKTGAGRRIMSGPFGDPRYSSRGWEKFEYITYARDGNKIQIHYMRNALTRETGQFKFISRGEYPKPPMDPAVPPGDPGPLNH
jgi:hypothetical protein